MVLRHLLIVAAALATQLPSERPPRRKDRPQRTLSAVLQRLMTRITEGTPDRAPWELANEQRSLISQILDLNRRQHELATSREHTLQRWRIAQQAPRVVIVSNRLPISVKRGADGRLAFSVSSGGMVSALLGVQHMRMVWVGWADLEDATPAEKQEVRRHMMRRGCVPIFLDRPVAHGYYNGFCNDVLWPLFHYVSRSPDDLGQVTHRGPTFSTVAPAPQHWLSAGHCAWLGVGLGPARLPKPNQRAPPASAPP